MTTAEDAELRTLYVVDAHRTGVAGRFVVRADDLLTAFLALYRSRHEMKRTSEPPNKQGWYWFGERALNLAARVVRVQEECGSLMLNDHETALYDAVPSVRRRAVVG